uniref:Uncharacterized protein n=1 Tax=uncultured marine virus TaxID=186617 RepID=A0A0F7L527_9VIRU|nr:hypothetical protein [uncultured marine virus]
MPFARTSSGASPTDGRRLAAPTPTGSRSDGPTAPASRIPSRSIGRRITPSNHNQPAAGDRAGGTSNAERRRDYDGKHDDEDERERHRSRRQHDLRPRGRSHGPVLLGPEVLLRLARAGVNMLLVWEGNQRLSCQRLALR